MAKRNIVFVGDGMTKLAFDRSDASVRDLVVEAIMAAVEDAGVVSMRSSTISLSMRATILTARLTLMRFYTTEPVAEQYVRTDQKTHLHGN